MDERERARVSACERVRARAVLHLGFDFTVCSVILCKTGKVILIIRRRGSIFRTQVKGSSLSMACKAFKDYTCGERLRNKMDLTLLCI